MKKFAVIMLGLMLATGCEKNTVQLPEDVAIAFVEAYYRYDFRQAEQLATAEGRRILVFRASNTTQEELDAFNAQEESVKAENTGVTLINDSTTSVRLHMSNGDVCRVTVVDCNGQWLVKAISF